MKKLLVIILLNFIAFYPVRAQSIDELSFYTEEYPPYNFRGPSGMLQGIGVDVLYEILHKMNSNKTIRDIQLLKWNDVYQKLLFDKNIVGFVTTRSESRENLFKWAGPILFSRTVVLGKMNSPKLDKIEDIKNYKIVVIENDAGHHIGEKIGIPSENFIKHFHLDDVLETIESGKADFWIYEETVAFLYLKSKGKADNYKVIDILGANNLSFAFSKDVSDDIVSDFQDALDEVKASSTFADILDRYLK